MMPTTVLERDSSLATTSPPLPQNGREARNLAEKHRRDKLNASIQELATMVPHVHDSTRRMDKTAVLRFAAHGLRLQYVFGKTAPFREHDYDDPQPSMQHQMPDALMQLLDSFFLTLTCHGQIVLISSNVETLLGHCQSDLYGQNILHIVHPEDQALLLQQLIPRNMEALFRNEDDSNLHMDTEIIEDLPSEEECNLAPSLHSLRYNKQRRRQQSNHFADIDKSLREDRRCFTIRLARAGTRSETTRKYEIVMVDGLFRRSDCSASTGNFPIVSQLIRRSRNNNNSNSYAPNMPNWMQHDVAIAQAALHGISGNDIVFVAVARVIRPPKIIGRLLEANNLEYRTRHLIDGRIIDCDQRIGLVAGYMKDEVRNLCPFTFMHQDDVRWVIVALRQMYDCNSDYGESCYRLLSRNGHFIYLQTKGYLEIEKSTNKVHSFVCVNTLLDEEEGRRKVQEMKKKFSIIIKAKVPNNSIEDVPASQNPQQLERIVLYLIENLQKRNNDCQSNVPSVATSRSCNNSNSTLMHIDEGSTLALVPPEPDSVRSSISKSVNIVNVTAARNLQYNLRSPASYQSSEISLSPASSIDHVDDIYGDQISANMVTPPPPPSTLTSQRPSVLVQPNKLMPPQQTQATHPNPHHIQQQQEKVENTNSSSPVKQMTTICNTARTKRVTNGTVSVLKRMPPPSSTYTEDCISPAKRTPPLLLGDEIRVLNTDLKEISEKEIIVSDHNTGQNESCSLPTLTDQECLNTMLLDNVQSDAIMLDNIKTEFIYGP